MPAVGSEDAQVVLVIEAQNQLAECIVDIPRNKSFLRNVPRKEMSTSELNSGRDSTPAIGIEQSSWELRLDKPPLRNGEWVFGSSEDPKICDIQLAADQRSGVSRRQFKIFHNFNSRMLLIGNLSRRGTYIRTRGEFDPLRATMVVEPSQSYVIRAGALQVAIILPDRTKEMQLQHVKYLERFMDTYRNQVQESSAVSDLVKSMDKPTPALVSKGNFDLVLKGDIGQGYFGLVQLGIQKTTGEVFAVKVIDKKKLRAHFDDADKRLANEKALAVKVIHTNVVQFHQVIDEPNTMTIIMNFAKLGDLSKHMHSNRFLLQEIHVIARQQCSAIAYLHDIGITHRDIKPENILLESRKPLVTKLADFGETSLSVELRTYSGTEAYQAPELEEKRESDIYTNKVDVWSLGLVLV